MALRRAIGSHLRSVVRRVAVVGFGLFAFRPLGRLRNDWDGSSLWSGSLGLRCGRKLSLMIFTSQQLFMENFKGFCLLPHPHSELLCAGGLRWFGDLFLFHPLAITATISREVC